MCPHPWQPPCRGKSIRTMSCGQNRFRRYLTRFPMSHFRKYSNDTQPVPTTSDLLGWMAFTNAGMPKFIPRRLLFTSMAMASPLLTMTKSTSPSSSPPFDGSLHLLKTNAGFTQFYCFAQAKGRQKSSFSMSVITPGAEQSFCHCRVTTAKVPSELAQKHQVKHHKSTKWIPLSQIKSLLLHPKRHSNLT